MMPHVPSSRPAVVTAPVDPRPKPMTTARPTASSPAPASACPSSPDDALSFPPTCPFGPCA